MDNGIIDYSKAIELDPESVIAYYCRGIAYSDKGEMDNAISDYSTAIELGADSDEIYGRRGNAYFDKSNYEHAIEDYTKAIQLNPDHARIYYNNRGVARLNRGEFKQAVEDYTNVIELNPDHANSYYNRSEALLHLQEWERAKADLIVAKEKGMDIITAFCDGYESIDNFGQMTGIQLPEDIAALLTHY